MKFSQNRFLLTYIFTCGILFQVSCAKDADLLSEYVINDVGETSENQILKDTIKLPADFDWSTIPDEYSNSVLEINDSFNLHNQHIVLPSNVTLFFNEGQLENGSIEGDNTLISTDSREPIVEEVTFTGTYENEYVMPYWYGAKMDGVTDDRAAFIETLAYADSLGLKVLVDKDIFLDVEETGKKSIFLEDNTWIEGANDARIIVNNLLSPAFIIALAENISIKNITIFYDQSYDANFGYDNQMSIANTTQLKNYLVENRGLVFNNQNPVWKGQVSFRYTILLEAARNVLFENVKMVSKGTTANTFMVGAIKLKEEYSANQIISNNSAPTSICNHIIFKNLEIDGAIMGIQGIVDNLTIDGLRGYRYSDVQTINGGMVGGLDYWMPPPHLIYLNSGNSENYICKNITILNTIDYGNYVGTSNVREEISGYSNSLKLVDFIENVVVDNYASYRRDGLGDWGGITNGVFSNIYAESKIDIFNPNFKFNSLRFLGPLNNISINNMTIKDNSESIEIYPMDYALGDNVSMDNVNVEVNILNNTGAGPFGISGSNNKITNSSLSIEEHISTLEYSPIIYQNETALKTGDNNFYDIQVNGWRLLDINPIERCIRIILANSDNSNNYAKVTDNSNNYIIEQTNSLRKDFWSRDETVTLGSGNSIKLNMTIPNGYVLDKLIVHTLEDLSEGTKISLGTKNSEKQNLISTISEKVGVVSKDLDDANLIEGISNIYLFANQDFNNTGKIQVTINLVRSAEY
ncbi:hypothetical protein CLV90_0781 [Maribacter spongiicola]|uniref:Uncharacterized protein n=1 Tax=Maribacter spongiicola TaxID=1206753 RepID=A0A4V3ERM7_9FLAO|nr:hypothetical protein [Maribacter spongiicola]TDT46723.1 hypothetical protein CLV90_0781 [Maribacter spongiicola]